MDASSVKKTPVQPVQAPKRTEEAHRNEERESRPKPPEAKKVAEARPAPVVNTQGQTTGRLVNTTA